MYEKRPAYTKRDPHKTYALSRQSYRASQKECLLASFKTNVSSRGIYSTIVGVFSFFSWAHMHDTFVLKVRWSCGGLFWYMQVSFGIQVFFLGHICTTRAQSCTMCDTYVVFIGVFSFFLGPKKKRYIGVFSWAHMHDKCAQEKTPIDTTRGDVRLKRDLQIPAKRPQKETYGLSRDICRAYMCRTKMPTQKRCL